MPMKSRDSSPQHSPRSLPDGIDLALLDGWLDAGAHHYLLKVQYEDTDLGGIIYHANYLKFAERARSGCLRCLGINQEDAFEAQGGGDAFVVRHASIDFVRAAGLGAVICVTSRVLSLTGVRLKMEQTIKNHENGHILAGVVAEIVYVSVDGQGAAQARRMPGHLKERLQAVLSDRADV